MFTKTFWKAALTRCIRTVCQSAIAAVGTATVLGEVDFVAVGSTAALAGILSILNAIATGLPEASEKVDAE